MLLEDVRGALADLHLTVSTLAANRLCGGNSSGGIVVNSHGSSGNATGNAAFATHSAAAADMAEKALARAAACNSSLPLGRRRTGGGILTAHYELWALTARPWCRDQLRLAMHIVLTGQAPPDMRLQDLTAIADPKRGVSSTHNFHSTAVDGGTAALPHGDTDAAAADRVLRRAPSPVRTARVVQEVYAAKAAADATARRPASSLCNCTCFL